MAGNGKKIKRKKQKKVRRYKASIVKNPDALYALTLDFAKVVSYCEKINTLNESVPPQVATKIASAAEAISKILDEDRLMNPKYHISRSIGKWSEALAMIWEQFQSGQVTHEEHIRLIQNHFSNHIEAEYIPLLYWNSGVVFSGKAKGNVEKATHLIGKLVGKSERTIYRKREVAARNEANLTFTADDTKVMARILENLNFCKVSVEQAMDKLVFSRVFGQPSVRQILARSMKVPDSSSFARYRDPECPACGKLTCD